MHNHFYPRLNTKSLARVGSELKNLSIYPYFDVESKITRWIFREESDFECFYPLHWTDVMEYTDNLGVAPLKPTKERTFWYDGLDYDELEKLVEILKYIQEFDLKLSKPGHFGGDLVIDKTRFYFYAYSKYIYEDCSYWLSIRTNLYPQAVRDLIDVLRKMSI